LDLVLKYIDEKQALNEKPYHHEKRTEVSSVMKQLIQTELNRFKSKYGGNGCKTPSEENNNLFTERRNSNKNKLHSSRSTQHKIQHLFVSTPLGMNKQL
jgi:hypothetical protein